MRKKTQMHGVSSWKRTRSSGGSRVLTGPSAVVPAAAVTREVQSPADPDGR
jgi:hypothetical protein